MISTLFRIQLEMIQSLLALRRYANWRLVRSLAELQLLTRASYAMLVIVPLLAGLWPAVRLVVNQHNKAVVDATAILDRSADRATEAQAKLRGILDSAGAAANAHHSTLLGYEDQFSAAVHELRTSVSRYRQDYLPRSIETPLLPRALAAAFVAALSVVLAHMLYQVFAPETVRRMTLDQYILDRKDDYAKHATLSAVRDAESVMETDVRAYDFRNDYSILDAIINKMSGSALDKSDADSYISKLTLSDQEALREYLNNPDKIRKFDKAWQAMFISELNLALSKYEKARSPSTVDAVDRQRSTSLIARAAQVSYLRMAEQSAFAMIITSCMYGFSIYMISTISINQTSHVMQAAAIRSFPDLLEWWKPVASR